VKGGISFWTQKESPVLEGRRALSARKSVGLSRLQLAAEARISASTVGNLERGKTMKGSTRDKIQRALEAHGVKFADGSARPLADGRFLPRRDGRIVLLHRAAISLARFKAGWSRGQLASKADLMLDTILLYESSDMDLRLRPEVAERLFLLFEANGVVLTAR
jgi:transcriptional regulator with XRE-family HTH domain